MAENEKNAIEWHDAGTESIEKDDYNKAIENYSKAIELRPNYADAYCNRGIAYYFKENYDEAIEDYSKAIELYQKASELSKTYIDRNITVNINLVDDINKGIAYSNRGVAYKEKGEYDKAIEDYTEAITLNQNDTSAYSNRGVAYKQKGDHDKAIEDYTKATELNPKYAMAYHNIGVFYTEKGDYDKATEAFAKARKFGDEKINIYFFISKFIIKESPDDIFKRLRGIDIIWEKDIVYKHITEYGNNLSPENIEDCKKLWFYQYVLLYILSLKGDSEIDIASYCDIKTLKTLLNIDNQGNNKEANKLRLTSLSEANDIEEGNVLLKLLEKKCDFICKEGKEDTLVPVQRSFTRNKDSLTMFRLYGKNENKEAAGACLVLKKSFFDTNDTGRMPLDDKVALRVNADNTPNNDTPTVRYQKDKNQKLPLYYVLYYDKETDKLIYNPTTSKYDNVVIDLKFNKDIIWEIPDSTFNKERNINNIQFIFNEIFDSIKRIASANEENSKIIYMLLINLHYLIKDVAFIEESELRLLEIVPDDENLKDDFNINKSYKDYFPVIDDTNCYVKEVILGNKSENAKWLKGSLEKLFKKEEYKKCGEIKVSVSELPLR